jgi:hypothetical protein
LAIVDLAKKGIAMRGIRGGTTRAASLMLLLSAIAAGCGGGRDPVLGTAAVTNNGTPPSVMAVTPVNAATGVAIYKTLITARLSEAVSPITGGATFIVACAASPCTSPSGTVTLDATNTIATFTSAIPLTPLMSYTATISGAVSLSSGLTMTAPFVWHFTAGAVPPPPTITAVSPLNNATDVAINSTIVAVDFSEPMAAIAGTASFTVTCVAPCVSPTGTLSRDASDTAATFRLAAATNFAPLTLYTATVTGATSLATGFALAAPYSWQFTTGATLDVTRPQVTLTFPATSSPGPTPGAPANAAITAAFTEDMDPASISATSFTVTCVAPCVSPTGSVSYASGNQTATFVPAAELTAGVVYTATISTMATDLAGNALAGNQAALPAASNYVWTFTAAGATAAANVSVLSTVPTNTETGICPNASINATFDVPSGLRMDPSSVNSTNFTVTGPTGPAPTSNSVIAASVVLDAATGHIATFTPQAALTVGGVYTATIAGGSSGVRDLAVPANDMLISDSWTFTVGAATGNCLAPPSLLSAAPYGDFGGSAGTTNTGIVSVVNGNLGSIATTTSSITGFHDTAGDIYTQTPANVGTVNGTISTCTNSTTGPTSTGPNATACSVATQALADANAAYLEMTNLPPGANPGGNLAGLTLAPGVYTAPGGSFAIQGANLTLDAQGNANAVWVFQMSTTLTVGGPGAAAPQSVILSGGAQAKNVFWQVGSAATINAGGGGTMVGTIISQAGATFSTVGNTALVTLDGRVLSLGASVTLVDTVINVPAP